MKRLTSFLLLASFALSLLAAPAWANERGKRHTTVTLGAAAVAAMLLHHPRVATWLGVGAGYSYLRWQKEHAHNQRLKAYRHGYQQGRLARR